MAEDPQATLRQLENHLREATLLESISSLLNWDERTYLPAQSGAYRADQITYLAGQLHQQRTDPKLGEWLEILLASPLAAESHSDAATTIREAKRDYDQKVKLPQELVEELTRAAVIGQQTWVESRKNDDFKSFQPILSKIIKLKQEEADALGWQSCRYDALLDQYEPGATTAEVDRVLTELRADLVPLVAEIADSPRRPQQEIVTRAFPIDKQKELGQMIAAEIGFDFDRGRLDITHHPFCTEMGPHDCRITTRYNEHFFNESFFGTLHEAGHGIYQQGLRPELYGLPPGTFVSLGIHESQSRMWENLVGRSLSFWQHVFPQAQHAFPAALESITCEQFFGAVNDVRPSLIRVEADEATYNLHIIVRFELEQALVNNELLVEDLPGAWNEKYQKYIGIVSDDHRDGVLQDVHWSAGLIGYFPTYALGNLYASQFFDQAGKDLGELGDQFSQGEFLPLKNWLNEKIHRPGQCYQASELVQSITDAPLSHQPLMSHLRSKLGSIYTLS